MKSVRDIKVANKRVLVRADFNVFMDARGEIADDFRIRAVLPTIKYLLENNAKVILMSHLGKPKGKIIEDLRLDGVARRLSDYLGFEVLKVDDCVDKEAQSAAQRLQVGQALLLENLRFHKEEEENDDNFASKIAELGDIYVNDAFAVSHRKHASVAAITKHLPSYAGLLLEKEVSILSQAKENPQYPLVVIIGGAKISTKIKMIKSFLGVADHILLGGALANTVLHTKGVAIGQSFIEMEAIEEVKDLEITDTKLHLPVDTIVSVDKTGQAKVRIEPVGKIGENELILDIGPETEELFANVIKEARTIVWNGSMGLFEVEKFAHGTEAIARAVADCDCQAIIGGGETIAMIHKLGLADKIFHISTGGGAMLKFLAGENLPGLEAIDSRSTQHITRNT